MGTFAERLRDSMTMAGISVARLSKLRGVSRKTVHDWLAMERATLSGEHVALVALDLGVSVRWLALGIGTPTPIGLKEAREARLTA